MINSWWLIQIDENNISAIKWQISTPQGRSSERDFYQSKAVHYEISRLRQNAVYERDS